MTRYHMSQPPPVGEYDVEYVVNPSGTVWGIRDDHPSPHGPRKPGDPTPSLVELAEQRENGWRLATEDEIREHCKATGDWLPPELEEPKRAATKADEPKTGAPAAESGGQAKAAVKE